MGRIILSDIESQSWQSEGDAREATRRSILERAQERAAATTGRRCAIYSHDGIVLDALDPEVVHRARR